MTVWQLQTRFGRRCARVLSQCDSAPNAWRASAGAYRDTLFFSAVTDGTVPAGNYYWRRELDAARVLYDSIGRQRYVVDRLGNKAEYGYVSAVADAGLQFIRIAPWDLNLRYNFTYSANAYRISDPGGRVMTDSLSAGRLNRIIDPGITQVTLFSYDNYNRVTRWRSRRQFFTAYRYHTSPLFGATGLLLSDSLPIATGPNSSHFRPVQLQALANTTGSNPTVRVDSAFLFVNGPRADGDSARFLVNGNQAPTTIIDPVGVRTTIAYNAATPLLPITSTRFGSATVTHNMDYDSLGRLLQATDATHSGGAAITEYRYEDPNVRDKPTKVITHRDAVNRDTAIFTYSNGMLKTARSARGDVTSFMYTPEGQVERVTNALQQSVNFTYDFEQRNLGTVTTHLGHTTTYSYDLYGNVSVNDPPVGASVYIYRSPKLNLVDSTVMKTTTDTIRTRYLYDADGNLTRITDPRNIARNYAYDALGNQTRMTDELGKFETREYAPDGLLLRITHRDGSTITIDRDVMGRDTLRRLDAEPTFSGAGSYDEIRKHYDTNSNLTWIDNNHSTITRTHTPEGSLASEIQVLKFAAANNATFTYEYWYNLAGARDSMRLGGNRMTARTVRYMRGPDNLLEQLNWDTRTALLNYDELGRRKTITFPNTLPSQFTYTGDGMLSNVQVPGATYAFTQYDALGRPKAMNKNTAGAVADYSWNYDDFGRLLSVGGSGHPIGNYQYDRSGNRIREEAGGLNFLYTYVSGTNRLNKRCRVNTSNLCISDAEYQQFTYNLNGDVVRRDENFGRFVTFFRDAAGQLTTYYKDSIQWRYDGLGRMVSRRDGYRHNILTSYDGVNVAWHDNLSFLHGDGVDDPIATLANSLPCYFVTLDARLYAYLTEGQTEGTCAINWETHGRFAGAISESYTFGLEREEESEYKISYFRNRWYDAQTGRFMQEDPIGYDGGSNLYAYAGNDPASYTDPFGLCPDLSDPLCNAFEATSTFIGSLVGFTLGGGGGALVAFATGGAAAPAVPAAALAGFAAGATAGLGLGRTLSNVLFREGSSGGGRSGGDPAQSWARQHRLNASSPTTQGLYNNRAMNVDKFISRFRKGNIREVFPSEYLNMTVDEALQQGGGTVRKLLVDGRFVR